MLNWPASSPDLSPDENIWDIVKRKYDKGSLGLLSICNPLTSMRKTEREKKKHLAFKNNSIWSLQFSSFVERRGDVI